MRAENLTTPDFDLWGVGAAGGGEGHIFWLTRPLLDLSLRGGWKGSTFTRFDLGGSNKRLQNACTHVTLNCIDDSYRELYVCSSITRV